MLFQDFLWFSLMFHGVPWFSQIFHNFPWFFYDFLWFPILFHDFLWFSTMFNDFSWFSRISMDHQEMLPCPVLYCLEESLSAGSKLWKKGWHQQHRPQINLHRHTHNISKRINSPSVCFSGGPDDLFSACRQLDKSAVKKVRVNTGWSTYLEKYYPSHTLGCPALKLAQLSHVCLV